MGITSFLALAVFPSKGNITQARIFLVTFGLMHKPLPQGAADGASGDVSLCEHPSSHEPCSLRKGTTHKPETFLLRLASCASPFLKGLRMARVGMSAGVNILPRASRVPFEREQRTSQQLSCCVWPRVQAPSSRGCGRCERGCQLV